MHISYSSSTRSILCWIGIFLHLFFGSWLCFAVIAELVLPPVGVMGLIYLITAMVLLCNGADDGC